MPTDTPDSSPPPLGVENYQLGAEISTGGMGSVLEAIDAKLDRTVAIKVMLLEANADARMRQRFLREAQVLAKLAHPNIVPIYDIVWEDGMPLFYSMKLVKGRTLQAILTDLRKEVPEDLRDYPLTRLLGIFRKVCDAIAFAHSQGVLHRDLKPENIMVGEFGEVLVMDWGLAKRQNDECRMTNDEPELSAASDSSFVIRNSSFTAPQHSAAHTLAGAVLGTPQYMSPEQARGSMAEVDELSDIYALGGILYAILTLRPPVDGKTALEVLEKVSRGEITAPTALKASSGSRGKGFEKGEVLEAKLIKPLPHIRGARVPTALSAVAMKALHLDKARRYDSVTTLSTDIEAYQNGFA
ncbi:MAG: serine/threonine-protein kinase, partial [Prosthecobacter sp.]|nr:serine/threonine-protein kinase [Prosthecobacter sp.]